MESFDQQALLEGSAVLESLAGSVTAMRGRAADASLPVRQGILSANTYAGLPPAQVQSLARASAKAIDAVADRLAECAQLIKFVQDETRRSADRAEDERARRASVGETLNA
jgi:hypothetical protein